MRLDAAQLEHFRTQGFVVIPCPWPAALTATCLADYERVIGKAATAPATPAELEDLPADLSKFRLRPAGGHESGWGTLDHSLPFLQAGRLAQVRAPVPSSESYAGGSGLGDALGGGGLGDGGCGGGGLGDGGGLGEIEDFLAAVELDLQQED